MFFSFSCFDFFEWNGKDNERKKAVYLFCDKPRGGGRTKGPAKRSKEDDARFEAVFMQLLHDTFLRVESKKGIALG